MEQYGQVARKWSVSIRDLLMVSHAPGVAIRTRCGELAAAAAKRGRTVDLYDRPHQPPGLRPTQRLRWHLRQLTCTAYTEPIAPGLSAVYGPTASRFSPLVRFCERRTSSALLDRCYRTVVTAAYKGLFFPRQRGTAIVYDLVDNHADGLRRAGHRRLAQDAEQFIIRQVAEADLVIASSLVLQDLAREVYGRNALLISNGASVATIRNLAAHAASARRKYRIGYMGAMDKFVRIDILVRAVERIRQGGVPAELVIVGDGPAVDSSWQNIPWIHLLGFRPPDEIPGLLATMQVGVVPFELSPFTNAALPLKVIEYGAARIAVVGSPIQELRRRSFPWVSLVELDEEAWTEALAKALDVDWRFEWDAAVDPYEWSELANRLLRAIDSLCDGSACA
jgi:glycosyltransferase involved in cell wall biosynthesis